MPDFAVETKGLCSFSSQGPSLRGVHLRVSRGAVHGILGDRGSGKTALLETLMGLRKPASGEITVMGNALRRATPQEARKLRMALARGRGAFSGDASLLDYVLLGREETVLGFLQKKKALEKIKALNQRYQLQTDLSLCGAEALPGARLRAQVLKMLYSGAEIFLLDDPCDALPPLEKQAFFQTLKEMAREGKTVIFSARSERDILLGAEECTVLRNGESVWDAQGEHMAREPLLRFATGTEAGFPLAAKKEIAVGSVVLEARDLRTDKTALGEPRLRGVSLEARAGELLYILGAEGSGKSTLAQALMGVVPLAQGRIRLKGKEITSFSTGTRLRAGMRLIPGGGAQDALALSLSLAENAVLHDYKSAAYQDSGFFKRLSMRAYGDELAEHYGLDAPYGGDTLVCSMPENERQKALIAREIDRECELLLADEPMAHLSAREQAQVCRQLMAIRGSRKAVAALGDDPQDPLCVLADRILVLCRGEIVGEFDPAYTTPQELGLYMTGARRQGWEEPMDEE